ncbi:hypothetical protein DFH06DRAFT_1425430 [Mycena polygramma]|nr:hypothetical protein DFH06DRAFT_1425430 [Mycena polygramma]
MATLRLLLASFLLCSVPAMAQISFSGVGPGVCLQCPSVQDWPTTSQDLTLDVGNIECLYTKPGGTLRNGGFAYAFSEQWLSSLLSPKLSLPGVLLRCWLRFCCRPFFVPLAIPKNVNEIIAGQRWASSSCTPLNCAPGQFVDNNACADCQAGTSGDGESCSQCPVNTYSADTAQSCAPCPAHSSSVAGSSSCTFDCPAGQFVNGNACTVCAAGTKSAGGAVTSCKFVNGTSCTPCAPGMFSAAGSTSCRIFHLPKVLCRQIRQWIFVQYVRGGDIQQPGCYLLQNMPRENILNDRSKSLYRMCRRFDIQSGIFDLPPVFRG